jgi:hypothetical protein
LDAYSSELGYESIVPKLRDRLQRRQETETRLAIDCSILERRTNNDIAKTCTDSDNGCHEKEDFRGKKTKQHPWRYGWVEGRKEKREKDGAAT